MPENGTFGSMSGDRKRGGQPLPRRSSTLPLPCPAHGIATAEPRDHLPRCASSTYGNRVRFVGSPCIWPTGCFAPLGRRLLLTL